MTYTTQQLVNPSTYQPVNFICSSMNDYLLALWSLQTSSLMVFRRSLFSSNAFLHFFSILFSLTLAIHSAISSFVYSAVRLASSNFNKRALLEFFNDFMVCSNFTILSVSADSQPFILLDNIPIIRLSFLVIGFKLLCLLPEFCDNIVTAVVKEISIDDV